ncbi:unnamed protein product [Mytilus coruscus]|uniref:Uncharacterized protein n=1 Tax=Mytilus coruscus TaxID=42192 RepID=A0A6J8C7G5_MYTCO|nr:unnamed protein product [Mytilus coruscus]
MCVRSINQRLVGKPKALVPTTTKPTTSGKKPKAQVPTTRKPTTGGGKANTAPETPAVPKPKSNRGRPKAVQHSMHALRIEAKPRITTVEKEVTQTNKGRTLLVSSNVVKKYKLHSLRGYGFKFGMNPKTGHNEVYRSIAKRYAMGNEGIGSFHHCHGYVETSRKKMKLETFRRFFVRRNRFLTDISAVRNSKKSIKYTTKEDQRAIVTNIDLEETNNRFQFETIHQLYRDDMSAFNSCLLSKAVDRCEPHINKHLLEKLQTTVKKGIWVYGPPGTGKSCTVLWFTQGNHYEIPQETNRLVKEDLVRRREQQREDEMIAKQMSREGDLNICIGLKGVYYDTKTHYQCLHCDKVLTKANKARHSEVCVKQPNLDEITVTQVLNEVFGKISPRPTPQTKACSCYVCDKIIPYKDIKAHIAEHKSKGSRGQTPTKPLVDTSEKKKKTVVKTPAPTTVGKKQKAAPKTPAV